MVMRILSIAEYVMYVRTLPRLVPPGALTGGLSAGEMTGGDSQLT